MAVGDPTGADLASGTTNGNTLTIAAGEREVTISSPIALISGYKYAIVAKAPSGNSTNFVQWWRKSTDVYAGGNQTSSLDAGSNWIPTLTTDFWFATKASGVEKDTQKTNDISTAAVRDTVWQAQIFTASSNYTISSINLKISRIGSPGTVTVSIKAIEGETYFNPPSPGVAGENNMVTVRRLIAVANDKFWYESI